MEMPLILFLERSSVKVRADLEKSLESWRKAFRLWQSCKSICPGNHYKILMERNASIERGYNVRN